MSNMRPQQQEPQKKKKSQCTAISVSSATVNSATARDHSYTVFNTMAASAPMAPKMSMLRASALAVFGKAARSQRPWYMLLVTRRKMNAAAKHEEKRMRVYATSKKGPSPQGLVADSPMSPTARLGNPE